MYQNLDHHPSTSNSPKPLSIRLNTIVPGEREIFVNSVCSALIESRFGPGRGKPLVIRLSEWPELEPAVFYEMSHIGPAPDYTILPDSEMARRYSDDIIRRAITPPNPYTTTIYLRPDSSPNQGRGSP